MAEKIKRVLIVEDSPLVQQGLELLVSEIHGLAVAGTAHDVRQGHAALRQLKPDIVILDIQLPGGSGLDLLAALRGSASQPEMAIVFSSVGSAFRRTCLELGANFFFDKPLEFDLLEHLLRKLAIDAG